MLSLYPLGPASFLLVSPDELSATTILNDGRPLIIPSGRLHAMRWSRFLLASAGNLPSATEIELRGIPAHAWDLDTASQLLSDCCLPCGLHHRTNVQRDVFRLVAWCSNPRDIPPGIDLVIPEPTSGGETHEQRTLVYPVEISTKRIGEPSSADNRPPPPLPADDDHQRRRQQRRHSSTSSPSPAPAAVSDPAPSERAHRIPVHSRLGPPATGCEDSALGDVSCPVHETASQSSREINVPEPLGAAGTGHEVAAAAGLRAAHL